MNLEVFWFCVVAFFWTGFFVLEGFDFGVGVLHRFIGRTDIERRVAINTIGPFWDGNEVWLIVGGAAIFAAFPGWYATWFSAGYLALLLVVLALIIRGISFEFRGRLDTDRWRSTFSWTLVIGSLLVPLLLGVALGDLLAGLPVDQNQEFTGTFWNLLTPYGVYVGVTLTVLCLVHGATFLALRTTGAVRDRAHATAARIIWPAALLLLGFAAWTPIVSGQGFLRGILPPTLALAAMVCAVIALQGRRDGAAFTGTAFAIGLTTAAIFTNLYPDVLVSSTSSANNLTVASTASGHYALQVMTVVAVVCAPVVIAYQIWTYVVFRRRVSPPPDRPSRTPEQGGPRPTPTDHKAPV
jgi:cytochrome bd-type quinol oxidase subunit 2